MGYESFLVRLELDIVKFQSLYISRFLPRFYLVYQIFSVSLSFLYFLNFQTVNFSCLLLIGGLFDGL
ncbi:hypothetical protein LOK49_LG13G01615 [Camellia lanceoleosa]|uniref:Uncharacterized protein n=1 Tax=Camellia lanceoleosa TaxID=1840588 RepID=A0ACC0FJM2_9ERIC|nr:hypothetical protein LOK49_LG13G01615 [Camellia lanceoleosa]